MSDTIMLTSEAAESRAADREAKRCAAIAAVLQRTDRILLGKVDLSVMPMCDPSLAPGWTTGEDIWINFAKLAGKTDSELAALWGLNYHELSHVIFTPRLGGKLLVRAQRSKEFKTALNLAEDWRIETHFSALFTAAERYFRLAFLHLAVEASKEEGQPEYKLFPLAAGRLYLENVDRLRWKRAFADRFRNERPADYIGEAVAAWVEERRDQSAACYHEPRIGAEEQAERFDPAEVAERDRLLSLKGDEWADELERLALRYVSHTWANDASSAEAMAASKQHNEAIVRDAERLMLLMPWADSDYGHPTAQSGAMMGADLPSTGRVDNDLVDLASDAALRVIAADEAQRQAVEKALAEAGVDGTVSDDSVDSGGAEAGDSGDGEAGDSGPGDPAGDSGPGTAPGGQPGDGVSEGSGAPTASASGLTVNLKQQLNDATGSQSGAGGNGVSAGATRGGEWGAGRDSGHGTQLNDEQRTVLDRLSATSQEHAEQLADELDELMASREVQRDLRAVRDAVADALGEGTHLSRTGKGVRESAPSEIKAQRNRLARQLAEVRGALEGTYIDSQPTGRINLRSWINARPSERPHAFRAWLPDEVDEAGIEVVGLIDRSSSMDGVMDHASQVTWALASAVQRAEGKITLIGFADVDKTEVLSGRDDQLESGHYQSFGCYGSTNIAEALKKARAVLATSPMPNRLLYIVTDGGWGDIEEAQRELKIINQHAETVLVLLGAHMQRENRGCQHVVMANDVAEMGRELQRVIRRVSEAALRRVNINRGVTA